MSALTGFKVLELTQDVAGEYCAKLLSDFGADVIKIEPPGHGSPTRRLGPFAGLGPEHERSGLFGYLNTNKHSVALDLSSSKGVDLLSKMASRVDVVIDDYPPGWLASVGLSTELLPRLVLCSITAYGQEAPEELHRAEDLNVFHSSGWGYHTPSGAKATSPPLKAAGRFLVSYEAGLEAALCIVAALYDRELSQEGRFIDISKHAVMASRADYVLGQMVAGDMDVSARRSAFDLGGPSGIFACRDGYAYLWISAAAHWQGLRTLMGDPPWMEEFPERWLELECTPERVAQCRRHLTEWLQIQGKEAVSAAAQKIGLTMVPVNSTADLQRSPQYAFRKFFADVTHPVLGCASYPTVPYKLSVTPAQIKTRAPLLGEHTQLRLAELAGVDSEVSL